MNASVENLDHGDDIIGQVHAESTKSQYKNKVKHFEEWVLNTHSELGDEEDDGNFVVSYDSIPTEVLKEFMAHISKKRNRTAENEDTPYVYHDPVKLQSVQHVNGYKSALMDKFRTHGIQLDWESTDMLTRLMAGYRRIIQQKKQDGEMEIHEGK